MKKEMQFFIYLLEHYAYYKNMKATEVLYIWDNLELTDFIYSMYEMYHSERLENAFVDIDNLISKKKSIVLLANN